MLTTLFKGLYVHVVPGIIIMRLGVSLDSSFLTKMNRLLFEMEMYFFFKIGMKYLNNILMNIGHEKATMRSLISTLHPILLR
jgi:hypothetical protein